MRFVSIVNFPSSIIKSGEVLVNGRCLKYGRILASTIIQRGLPESMGKMTRGRYSRANALNNSRYLGKAQTDNHQSWGLFTGLFTMIESYPVLGLYSLGVTSPNSRGHVRSYNSLTTRAQHLGSAMLKIARYPTLPSTYLPINYLRNSHEKPRQAPLLK